MSTMHSLALELIYDTLTGYAGLSGTDIFSYVPGLPEGKPDEDFPYIVIGRDSARPFDTDSWNGLDLDIYVHVWSRYEGPKETLELMDHIYTALHRTDLSITGHTVVLNDLAFSQVLAPENKTFHGVVRFRLIITEGS